MNFARAGKNAFSLQIENFSVLITFHWCARQVDLRKHENSKFAVGTEDQLSPEDIVPTKEI